MSRCRLSRKSSSSYKSRFKTFKTGLKKKKESSFNQKNLSRRDKSWKSDLTYNLNSINSSKLLCKKKMKSKVSEIKNKLIKT